MRPILLDERLSLAIELFPICEIGADIGTDHGLFPCRLLEEGRCQRMILSDISEKALAHAQALVERRGLQDKTALVVANGLDCLTEPVDCVSIMGMGGRTIAEILHAGQARLHGATLVLSAHTDLELARQAVQDIGYHLTQERLCRARKPLVCFFTGCTRKRPLFAAGDDRRPLPPPLRRPATARLRGMAAPCLGGQAGWTAHRSGTGYTRNRSCGRDS